jgi:hypothetical protein
VQKKAVAALEEMGPAVVPLLRKEMAGDVKIPVRRLLEQVVENVQTRWVKGQQMAILRTLEVLERARTPEARELLAKLAAEQIDPWLTEEAKGCLERMDSRLPKR